MLPLSAISTRLDHVHINIIHSFVVVHTQREKQRELCIDYLIQSTHMSKILITDCDNMAKQLCDATLPQEIGRISPCMDNIQCVLQTFKSNAVPLVSTLNPPLQEKSKLRC